MIAWFLFQLQFFLLDSRKYLWYFMGTFLFCFDVFRCTSIFANSLIFVCCINCRVWMATCGLQEVKTNATLKSGSLLQNQKMHKTIKQLLLQPTQIFFAKVRSCPLAKNSFFWREQSFETVTKKCQSAQAGFWRAAVEAAYSTSLVHLTLLI